MICPVKLAPIIGCVLICQTLGQGQESEKKDVPSSGTNLPLLVPVDSEKPSGISELKSPSPTTPPPLVLEPPKSFVEQSKSVDWSKVPAIMPLDRGGWFTLPQNEPGFYSLLDWLRGEWRPSAPPFPFGATGSDPTPSYNRDFRYLDNPNNTFQLWSDLYKRVYIGNDFLFATGGELRFRFNNYANSQLSGKRDSFDVSRTRVYGDWWYRDQLRFFAEFIDAREYRGTLPPAATDVTGSDILNGFLEVKVTEFENQPVQLRIGRQEVILGSQRLLSSPDFPNTLRTYDGVRGYWHTPKWDVNLFWVRPVIPNPTRLDSSDDQRALSGLFLTHHPNSSTLIDVYLLNLSDARPTTKGNITTLGGRLAGDIEKRLLYDLEAATQVGTVGNRTQDAQMLTTGLGWHFANLPWNISLWAYFDYASGTSEPASGVSRTFNQLFPAGHTYFGYIDLVGRQNIQDLNFQLELNPQPWILLRAQYHIFQLAVKQDALYNAGGVPLRRDPTGLAGSNVGNELDLLANIHLTPRQDFFLGYSRFFVGDFIRATGPFHNPDYFYAQYTFRW
ncbi:MAG: alginate export family protein [Gemmataceae bacterium]|jgi:hypothetical protein|nr:alginate export family protein [Gemmataceae bacterium]